LTIFLSIILQPYKKLFSPRIYCVDSMGRKELFSRYHPNFPSCLATHYLKRLLYQPVFDNRWLMCHLTVTNQTYLSAQYSEMMSEEGVHIGSQQPRISKNTEGITLFSRHPIKHYSY